MRYLLLAIMCFLVSSPTFAGWILLGEGKDYKYYIDLKTLRSNSRFKEVWTLTDYKSAQQSRSGGTHYLSIKDKQRVSCADKRIQYLVVAKYLYNMGTGDIVSTSNVESENSWLNVESGTPADSVMEKVCGR